MVDNFATQFQEMLDYRKEHPINNRKIIRQKYKKLYRVLIKNESKIISLSRRFIGYSESETRALTLQPFFNYYHQCIKCISKKPSTTKINYSILSASYPVFRLRTSQGILLIEIGGLNPIFYFLASICNALLHSNSVVFYIKNYPKPFSEVFRKICELLFDKKEICCLNESELSLEVLLANPFNQIYSFTDKIRLKTEALTKIGSSDRFNFVIVDKKCQLSKTAQEIFYANALNAGYSDYNPDLVFVHVNVYQDLKLHLLKIARDPSKAHNIAIMNSYQNFERADKDLKNFEKNYRILNPQAGINKNPVTLYFPPILLEKIDVAINADSLPKERLLSPILPIIRYDNLDPIINFLNKYSYRYKLTIFSQHKYTINQIIQNSDSDLFYLNNIFSSFMQHITTMPANLIPEDPMDALASYKYVVMKHYNQMQEELVSPPLLAIQAKYLKFKAFMRRVKYRL